MRINNRINKRYAQFNKSHWRSIPDTIEDLTSMRDMWDIPKITGVNNIDFNTEVIYTSKFKSDYRLSDYQEEIDRLIDDIKNGYIYDNSPGNEADYTNCLVVESNNFQLTYEKRITSELTNDRLIYEVVKPNFKRGSTILTITVRLFSLLISR